MNITCIVRCDANLVPKRVYTVETKMASAGILVLLHGDNGIPNEYLSFRIMNTVLLIISSWVGISVYNLEIW